MKLSRYPDKAISQIEAKSQFEQWLVGARPEMVAKASVEQLAGRYRVDPRYLETRLLARQDQIRRAAP